MVAIFGCNMPTPLAMPVTRTDFPPTVALADAPLGTVSVVMIADAASAQWFAASVFTQSGSAASTRSTGRCSSITPVENGSTASGAQPIKRAAASQVLRAAAKPCAPVPQFALPALTKIARMGTPALMRSRHTSTGAAAKLFCVNTPATRVPGAKRISIKSRRPALRMPASAKPSSTPAIAASAAGSGAFKLTAISVTR